VDAGRLVTPYPRIEKPRAYCRSCGQDFSGTTMFDLHRVGVHEYTYSEGIAMTPMREDGRRCLSIDEVTDLGWALDERGRWCDPERVEAARAAFRKNT
jgi:hypothetical protein